MRKCSKNSIYGTAPDDCSCWFLHSNQVIFIDYSFFVFSKFFLFIINNRNYGSLSRKAIKMKIFLLFTIIYPNFNQTNRFFIIAEISDFQCSSRPLRKSDYTFFFIRNSIFWSDLWLLKLEKHFRSEVGKEVANKLKGYQKVLKRNLAWLWVAESFFTHKLNISNHYTKFIKQVKLFCNCYFVLYCIVVAPFV